MTFISNSNNSLASSPFLSLGFRPFFLGAGLFASLSLCLWTLIYHGWWIPQYTALSPSQWHAHEMIYGYGTAIIAGFLLTSVRNWTGIMTLQGLPLLGLFLLWLSARILFLFPDSQILAVFLNILFLISLSISLSLPLLKAKKWQQLGILSKVYLLTIFEFLFFLGQLEHISTGLFLGIYGGLYLLLGLLLIMSNRVIPFFIEKSTAGLLKIDPLKYLDIPALILFTFFFILNLLTPWQDAMALMALLLFLVNLRRLWAWHHPTIWKNPMLWSLYLGFACLTTGFLIIALNAYNLFYPLLSFHLLAYGGIGLISLGMMSRIALGHTGRDVNNPPTYMKIAFLILAIGVIFRVFLPLILMSYYSIWIMISQSLWIIAFSIFTINYFPILIKKRQNQ